MIKKRNIVHPGQTISISTTAAGKENKPAAVNSKTKTDADASKKNSAPGGTEQKSTLATQISPVAPTGRKIYYLQLFCRQNKF